MKEILSILVFLISISGFSQHYLPFNSEEIKLIQTDSLQMLRVYNLQNHGDSLVLKSKSLPVEEGEKMLNLLSKRMLLSVNDPINRGVGIAAPQVGINRRVIVVQRFDKTEEPFEVFVNPIIVWASDLMQLGPEGDLSFDERGTVMRHYIIEVQYQTIDGSTIREIMEGFTAVIFQHERDHLDGILLTDRIEEQKDMKFIPLKENQNLFYLEN